jgi:hypothetical protein
MVSPVRGDHRRFQAETPLIDLFKFAEPALVSSQSKPARTIRRLMRPLWRNTLAATVTRITDRYLASTANCVGDEIIEWLKRREMSAIRGRPRAFSLRRWLS